MFGLSTRVVDTKHQLGDLPGRGRSAHALWVYDHLVSIDHMRGAPLLVGAICGLVALVLAAVYVLIGLAIDPIVNIPGALVVGAIWIVGCTWAGAYLSKKGVYWPRILSCWSQMQEPYKDADEYDCTYQQALTDIECLDPDLVRRLGPQTNPNFPSLWVPAGSRCTDLP